MKCPITEGLRGSAKPDTFAFASKGARETPILTDKRGNHAVAAGLSGDNYQHPWRGVKFQFGR